MIRASLAALLATAALSAPAAAQTPDAAIQILTRSIAFRTEKGAGQVPAYAAYLKSLLVEAGFAEGDIVIDPLGETASLTARWPGADPGLKPTVLLGHMDVVTADPADWERDPYTAVIENGFVFGRGALDNKGDIAILTATLIKLKQSGWTPRRTLIFALTGDEETTMATTARLVDQLGDVEMVLNSDAGLAALDDEGQPMVYELQASEKTYADFSLKVTDPGGHSSRPGAVNAIYRLGAALARLEASPFPVTLDPITRTFLAASADGAPAAVGQAMRDLVADPTDAAAAAILTADPQYVGQIRTTCVPTQVSAGHAPNALPQQATANINCRILPGVPIARIEAELNAIFADPGVVVAFQETGFIASPASPLRDDVLAAVTQAVQARAPGLRVVPAMSAGATDTSHFRARGIPSYGVGTIFMAPSDDFAHGLNERLPVATIAPGMVQWESLIRTMAQ